MTNDWRYHGNKSCHADGSSVGLGQAMLTSWHKNAFGITGPLWAVDSLNEGPVMLRSEVFSYVKLLYNWHWKNGEMDTSSTYKLSHKVGFIFEMQL